MYNSCKVFLYFTESSFTTQYTSQLFPLVGYYPQGMTLITSIVPNCLITSTSTDGDIHTTPVLDSLNNIYFGSDDGNLYKLSPDFLTIIPQGFSGQLRSSPVISADGLNIYFSSTNDHTVWSFPLANFADEYPILGSYVTDDVVYSSPIVDSVNKNIIIGNNNNHLYSINFGDIQYLARWIHDFNPNSFGDTPGDMAIGGDGTVYVAVNRSNGAYMVALSQNGEEITQWAAPDGDNTMSSPVIGSSGTLYVASESGVSAFN